MPEPDSAPAASGQFATTHWSVVLAAGKSDASQANEALEKLCRTYWYPIYAYLRRRGRGEQDAQDLAQGFFAQLLERRSIQGVEREKGKFRSFLLASLNYYVADERDRAHAQKRGGGRQILSFDAHEAEERYRLEPVDERSPDKLFERRWAIALLDQVLVRLAEEIAQTVASPAEVDEELRHLCAVLGA